MADSTPSSLICFKNGYSYVNIPVTLTSEQAVKSKEPETHQQIVSGIRECQVGPLPTFAVHGTVALAAHSPETVKIFSVSQAAKKMIKALPLKVPEGDKDFSYEKFLEENIGIAVGLTCLVGDGTQRQVEKHFEGVIKAIHKPVKGESMVVLRSLQRNRGEQLIKCSSIVSLESVQITEPCDEGTL